MLLQNTVNGDWSYSGSSSGGQTFHFAVDTCSYMQKWTGNTECKDKDDPDFSVDNFIVATKISSEFFSGETYAANDHTLSSAFSFKLAPLSGDMLIHKAFSVIPQKVKFTPSPIYSDSVMHIGQQEFTLYAAVPSDAGSYPLSF